MTSLLIASLLVAPALTANPQPLTTKSQVPIGISDRDKLFVSIDENTVGPLTAYTPVAYKAPKWRKKRLKGAATYRVDLRDEETQNKTMEKAAAVQKKVDAAFMEARVRESRASAGGFTGRVRLMDLGVVIVLEDDTVSVRTGDASVMKTTPLIKRVSKLVKGCKGEVETKLMHVAAKTDWNAVAIRVEATCNPTKETDTAKRIRRLFVKDLSKILSK
jgi:hypothetical protein